MEKHENHNGVPGQLLTALFCTVINAKNPVKIKPRDIRLETEIHYQKLILSSEFIKKILKVKKTYYWF